MSRVSIFPIRYSPSKQEIQVVSSITIKINYNPGLAINPKTTLQKPIPPSFAKLYRNLIFNYDQVLQRKYAGREEGYDFMLCIMPDEFILKSFNLTQIGKIKPEHEITLQNLVRLVQIGTNPDIIKESYLKCLQQLG